mmetsp:Transcript_120083/g.339764  ORF Transcript_120083/g.339764 Transcript_120083/m.339764 type:complete len:247 (-) Transcript_120083:2911-3651(-)
MRCLKHETQHTHRTMADCNAPLMCRLTNSGPHLARDQNFSWNRCRNCQGCSSSVSGPKRCPPLKPPMEPRSSSHWHFALFSLAFSSQASSVSSSCCSACSFRTYWHPRSSWIQSCRPPEVCFEQRHRGRPRRCPTSRSQSLQSPRCQHSQLVGRQPGQQRLERHDRTPRQPSKPPFLDPRPSPKVYSRPGAPLNTATFPQQGPASETSFFPWQDPVQSPYEPWHVRRSAELGGVCGTTCARARRKT